MSFRAPEGNTRREPITTAVRLLGGTLFIDADGDWAITDERGITPDGVLVEDGDDDLAIDDDTGAADPLTIVSGPVDTLAY